MCTGVRLAAAVLCLALVGGAARAQEEGVRSSVGIRGSYLLPIGDWHASPVAPSVNLIGAGPGVEVDLDFAVGQKWTLGLEGGYASLNGSAWEDYVAGFGQRLEVSGSFVHLAVLLRPHLRVSADDALRFEVGPSVLFASGQEVFEGRTYPYDFLGGTSFGGRVGLEYYRLIGSNVALSLKAGASYFPEASEHAGGRSAAIAFLPLTAGLRILL